MTPNSPAPPQSAAVAAFLRGVDRRARLLASVQAGDAAAAQRALTVSTRVFVADAGQWPIAQWPLQFWRLLLSVPAMGQPGNHAGASAIPGIAKLPPPVRAAVLLNLVAALEDADAAAALDISTDAYHQRIRAALPTDALGQPDVDVWRAWRAAAQRALDASPVQIEAAPSAPATPSAGTSTLIDPLHRRRLRWLWLGVAACALALLASFFLHPRGRELLDNWRNHVRVDALPAADPPKAHFDASDTRLHPDQALLAAPQDLALAQHLPMLSWLAADAGDALSAIQPVIPEPTVSASDTLLPRMQRWDRLAPWQRAQQRGAWAEWQALPDSERVLLRATAARFAGLPLAQQQELRNRYAALPYDAHRGWHLGPQLGRFWPQIAALFAFVDDSERQPLLRLLRAVTPDEMEALLRLAQTTPPETRANLRRTLLALPAAQRMAWLQARLQR